MREKIKEKERENDKAISNKYNQYREEKGNMMEEGK